VVATTGKPAVTTAFAVAASRTPDFVFTAARPVHVLRDLGYLAFTYGMPEQPPASIGYDVALVRDGRVAGC
jgi:hypothetical protein